MPLLMLSLLSERWEPAWFADPAATLQGAESVAVFMDRVGRWPISRKTGFGEQWNSEPT
jgi:hypothetical protein